VDELVLVLAEKGELRDAAEERHARGDFSEDL